jgi:hypothetical protein
MERALEDADVQDHRESRTTESRTTERAGPQRAGPQTCRTQEMERTSSSERALEDAEVDGEARGVGHVLRERLRLPRLEVAAHEGCKCRYPRG